MLPAFSFLIIAKCREKIWHFRLFLYLCTMLTRIFIFAMVAMLAVGCSRERALADVNAVYYWRTDLRLDSTERAFLQQHHIKKVYCRYFDVVMGDDGEPRPNATMTFSDTLPDGIEMVPTVYITEDCMHKPHPGLAAKLVRRILQMNETNDIRGVSEIQIDCDYTARSRQTYYDFLTAVANSSRSTPRFSLLSATIRLHQLQMPAPPVDYGVLMVYNTGDLRSPQTANSILDYSDVKPYLRRIDASMLDSMDFAWPVFGWGVVFDADGRFLRLVPSSALDADTSAISLREEWGRVDDIQRVQRRLPARGRHTTILSHLDSPNLSKYTYDEIESIYSR